MKILVCAICYNQAHILNFWLRHYARFADEIWVADDYSTDGSREILQAHPLVRMSDWLERSGIDEEAFLRHAYATYPKAAGRFDWVIWVDTDEFVYGLDVPDVLWNRPGTDVVRTCGFNMVGEGVPVQDDGRQLWEQMPMGVRAPVYSKPVVFRPQAKIRWDRGKHHLAADNQGTPSSSSLLKLLHYRYLGETYTRAGNARNYARCGMLNGDKGAAWSCAPGYQGKDKEGSPEWSEFARSVAFNVIEAGLYD